MKEEVSKKLEQIFREFNERRLEIVEDTMKKVLEINEAKECWINNKEYHLDQEAFDYVVFYLGVPEIASNCCTAHVRENGTCRDCDEHCDLIYIFN